MQFLKKSGFTLAEVLIVLLIIGVVASLVIPSLINNIGEAEYNVGVKKAQAVLSQALQTLLVKNGGIDVGTAGSSSSILRNDFCSVLSCIKTEGDTYNIFAVNYKKYKGDYPPGSSVFLSNGAVPAASTVNGYSLAFSNYTDCNYDPPINVCAKIYIDINGLKGPNMHGMDLHTFWIRKKNEVYSILPAGTPGDLAATCKIGGTEGCTAQRITDPDNMPH